MGEAKRRREVETAGGRAFTRRLPSLTEFLAIEPGDGAFESFREWCERTLALESHTAGPREAMALRIISTFMVAIVECANREIERAVADGREIDEAQADVALMLARAAGYTSLGAVASILRDDTPWRSIAKVLGQEFDLGAKMFADQMVENPPAPGAAR